jgi:hypothetical protein
MALWMNIEKSPGATAGSPSSDRLKPGLHRSTAGQARSGTPRSSADGTRRLFLAAFALCATATIGHAQDGKPQFDVLIRGGTIYDGTGEPPVVADLGIIADKIATVGMLGDAEAKSVIDAKGLAVAPGFINMLSWATESLLIDGRGQSDLRQGVTLEVFGEGWSMGPLNERMRRAVDFAQGVSRIPHHPRNIAERRVVRRGNVRANSRVGICRSQADGRRARHDAAARP